MSCFRSEKTSVRNVPVRLVVAASLTVFAATTASAFQNWTGRAGNSVFNDPGNWVKHPAFLDLSTTGSGTTGGVEFDAHLELTNPSGVYTLSDDLVASRIVADKPDRDVVLDLKGHTLTLLGKATAESFYFRGDGPGMTVTFTNGTVLVPESPYQGYALSANYVNIAHNQYGLPTNVTLRIAGAGTVLKSPRTDLKYGAHNCISVENGATLETTLNLGGAIDKNNTVSEHLTLRLDAGKFKTTDGTRVFTVGGVANCISNELVFANGGCLENMNMHMFNIGTAAGARFSRVILEGAATVMSITNRPQFPASGSAQGSGYHVRKGASLTFANAPGETSLGRFWLAAGGEVVVTGEGSRLVTESGFPCNIGNAASGAQLWVSDHASAMCGALTAGSSVECDNNLIRVDTGASLEVGTCNLGGQMDEPSEKFCSGNRLEILSGGTVVAANCYVGSRSFSKDNVLLVSGSGSRLTTRSALALGVSGGVANQIEVSSNATVAVGGLFVVRGEGSSVRLAGGSLAASNAVFNAAAQVAFAYGGEGSAASFAVTHGGLTVPESVTFSIEQGTAVPVGDDEVWTLVSSSGALTVPESVLARLRLTVSEGLRLKKTAHALTVGRRKGLVLLFR